MKKPLARAIKYTRFETAWGEAGIAWSEQGICQVVLPGFSKAKILEEIRRPYPGAALGPAGVVGETIAAIQSYFSGEVVEFKARLDLTWAAPFRAAVYRALRQVKYGQTVAYGELAKAAGRPGAGRAVGQANAANRIPLLIPCHRVIRADGDLGGFSGPGGPKLKSRLLVLEKQRLFSCGE